MSRIPTPATIDAAPAAARPLLDGVQKSLGSVPNLFRLLATSPAALGGYLGLSGALAKGALDARTRERLALAIAEFHGCGYCLAAHSFIGANLAKLDTTEIAANRAGRSTDAKADAAIRFALTVVEARGQVGEDALATVRAAGWGDAEILEIILHVALNTLTNYVNEVAGTVVDFPPVAARAA
ncbi:carboxymuconolactone decarboxylase family protein [Roseomonas sp. HJA6]|uniref:Carboxymuconolactone decarboxylase family protein n=1 Tax=Roseomonas alba TaxID=2846776 RepID=A0ABS7A7E7_9PROT|nr:carboxymuconolactone decarboxylase family protein [Neoroseomonas alba]MBW6398218.1 carboxymuconolactone decarboxylase family protein [Neoroseomonas alba]